MSIFTIETHWNTSLTFQYFFKNPSIAGQRFCMHSTGMLMPIPSTFIVIVIVINCFIVQRHRDRNLYRLCFLERVVVMFIYNPNFSRKVRFKEDITYQSSTTKVFPFLRIEQRPRKKIKNRKKFRQTSDIIEWNQN